MDTSETIDAEVLAAFLDESDEALATVDQGFVMLESQPDDSDTLNAIFRAIHTIKGNSAFFGLLRVKRLAHQMEDLLALMRDRKVQPRHREISRLLAGLDQLKVMLGRVRRGQPELDAQGEPALDDLLRDLRQATASQGSSRPGWSSVWKQLHELSASVAATDFAPAVETLRSTLRGLVAPEHQPATSEGPVAPAVPAAALREAAGAIEVPLPSDPARATAERREKADGARTMRVDEQRIDEFLDYVGELIITREMFGNVGKRLRRSRDDAQLSTEFQRAMGAFTQLSHNLQRSIMEVRKVPVKLVLQKVPRMVRDVAEQAGKQAQATLSGGEISVDKSLIESFEAPLVHMVRNAVDHGVESPEERIRRGKPALGQIQVCVSETPDAIVCSISDDGGGIDVQKLKAKAVQLGVLGERAAAQLSDGEAFQLIFAAGLSTAAQVTDVSGRGVGMDVVKRNVTELGGRIEIESELGKGSRFTVHLPKAVTVQILDGFLVQVGNQRLVLPLRAINESFRPTREQLHTVAERGECVSRRGRVLPLVRFNRLLALSGMDRAATEAIVVSVQVAGGRSAGLLVDQVLGVQQVVLREVAGIDATAQVFAGGAVLGDGRVAMVVDVEKLGALVA